MVSPGCATSAPCWIVAHGKSIVPDLAEVLDAVSVSLNAATAEEYTSLCAPEHGEKTFDAVLDFIRECKDRIPEVSVSAVEVPEAKVPAVKKLAHELGVKYHGRKPNDVG